MYWVLIGDADASVLVCAVYEEHIGFSFTSCKRSIRFPRGCDRPEYRKDVIVVLCRHLSGQVSCTACLFSLGGSPLLEMVALLVLNGEPGPC